MKELIYHRHFLPAIERYPNRTLVIDGDYRATYRDTVRACSAARALCDSSGWARGIDSP